MALKTLCAICLATLFLDANVEQNILTIERAATKEQRQWGLMGRRTLQNNYGMLFSFDTPSTPTLWAFNCYVDIAALFLNQTGTIFEIGILKAFPEKMDPLRPVYKLEDMRKYPVTDPIRLFFSERSITPKTACHYILEITLSSYLKKQIKVGDKFDFIDNIIIKFK